MEKSKQKTITKWDNIPEDVYWDLQKIAVEKEMTLNEIILQSWLHFIDLNKKLLEKKISA